MKKGILLSIVAVVLVCATVFAIWYINEEGKIQTGNKDSFIPYNSALVINVNPKAQISPKIKEAFAADLQKYQKRLLSRVTDTLRRGGYVQPDSYSIAARIEGKSSVTLIYVMDSKDVLSRSETAGLLNQVFAGGKENLRKYDKHKIYSLKQDKEEVFFTICGGIVLVSDSDLYIEDGLKQFDLAESGEGTKPRYENLNKYFSVGAGVNIFLNTAAFTDLLPLYLNVKEIFLHVDITRFFKWGALDAEFSGQGICLNGFLQYGGVDNSYIRTLEKQQPRESVIEGVLPARLVSMGMLNLSQPEAYFAALDAYRYTVGQKESILGRKRQLNNMFGKGTEEEMRNLLQGEFAMVDFAFDETTKEKDGLVLAYLKSGSLCKILLEKMLKNYARFDKSDGEEYQKKYSIDREKSFTYYRFPAEDFAAVYWGYIFEGIKNRYVFVEDNYLILASSEKAVKNFIQDYVHGSFIRDVEWYRNLKTKLSAKYNMAYFAKTAEVLPFYKYLTVGDFREYVGQKNSELSVFSSLALQWSNEGDMLYNTLYLNTAEVVDDVRPHVLWQTKLEGRVSMKPVPVTNHQNGEREILVQDDKNTIYLINDIGRILWKLPLDGQVNSEVYQVDLYKNGKLQYLFSTASKIYLIDRNGNAVERFPIIFQSTCDQGITVFDYDKKRDYRIFAPCSDRQVYLYGLDGKLVEGWSPAKADKPIVSKVQHHRIAGKDYIVFADQYRLYILDRKGAERVRIASVFDLKPGAEVFLSRKGEQPVLVIPGVKGIVNTVDFAGQTQSFQIEELDEDYKINIADVNGDGTDECVITGEGYLSVYKLDGKLISEKTMEGQNLDYPYVYRFSNSDIRIGVTDYIRRQMFLISPDGTVAKGFPISGDSPFSIVFSGDGGFFLFAGVDNGSVIKYQVQR